MNEKNQSDWLHEATWPAGLYLRTSSGIYHARYRMNGSRTFHSYETNVFSIAKLQHAKFMAKVEADRQGGAVISGDFRTLEALATEFESRLVAATMEETTKTNYRNWIARLKANWAAALGSPFETAQARGVTLVHVAKLREHLRGAATYKIVNTRKPKTGYAPAVVNQTLTGLRMLLDLAVEKNALSVNPFNERGTLQASVFLPKKSKKPTLPSRADMERVFEDMARVPNAERYTGELAGRLAFLQAQARDVSEHARFLAYSGMRLEEGNACEIRHDHGQTVTVPGTKTEAAARTVPVTPELRKLMDEIKARRSTGPFLAVRTSRAALQRACTRLGLPKLTHHHLRHYFTTICVESGVDIPTVADWLGHTDGGALLMKTYRHLRQEHSLASAKKVQFLTAS